MIVVADKSMDSSAELWNAVELINDTFEPNVTEVGTSTVYASSCSSYIIGAFATTVGVTDTWVVWPDSLFSASKDETETK